MLPMKNILDIIQRVTFEGCDFLSKIGMSIFVMLIAIEFIKAAIDATSGRGFHIDKILYLYLFMAVFYAAFPFLQEALKQYAYDGCRLIYEKFGDKSFIVKPSTAVYSASIQAYLVAPFGAIIQAYKIALTLLIFVFAFLVATFASIVIDIVILSSFLTFEIVIASAPFFIPFFMSGETKHIGRQWMNNVLMCLLQLTMISIVLKMIEELNKFAYEYYFENLAGKLTIPGDIYMILFIPLLGLGLVWQAIRFSTMLFPPSGGFVGTAIGAPIAGAVGYAGHTVTRVIGGRKR